MKRKKITRPAQPADKNIGLGKGHGGKTPNLPEIREVTAPMSQMAVWQAQGLMEPEIKLYRMGKLKIILGNGPEHGWHLSISHPERYPTWDEIAHIRYRLVPDEAVMGMILPPRQDYINIHPHCFQLLEVKYRYEIHQP